MNYVKVIIEQGTDPFLGVNRKTFYDYFESRECFFRIVEKEILEEFVIVMGETNIKDEIVQAKVLISNGESLPQTIAVCEHIKQYQSFYTTSLKEGSFIERFSDLIYKELYRFSGNSAISTYISYGTVGYIKKWLDDGCKQSVEQVAFGMATASSKTLMESLK